MALLSLVVACDVAWDGPSFLAAGHVGAEDLFAGAELEAPGPDVFSPPDAHADAGGSLDDLSNLDDSGAPDLHGPELPPIVGCEPPEGSLNPLAGMQLSDQARPDWGLDLDGNPETCHPYIEGKLECSFGVDNSLAALAPVLDPVVQALADQAEGPIFALQHLSQDPDAAPYRLAVWTLSAAEGEACHSEESCTISLHSLTDEGTCEPAWYLDNALILGEEILVAGRYDSRHRLRVTVGGPGIYREIDVFALQLRALVTRQGEAITSIRGVIGGAIRFTDLVMLVGLVPGDFLGIDFDSDWIIQTMNWMEYFSDSPLSDLVLPDGGDAVSFAVTFEAFGARAAGGGTATLPVDLAPYTTR